MLDHLHSLLLKKISIVCLILLSACKKDPPPFKEDSYDIFLVCGQSNTHQGLGLDPLIDTEDPRVKQFGRFGSNSYKIIPSTEPLEHITPLNDCVGFALTFAKTYEDKYGKEGRKALIVPCGQGGSAFHTGYWTKGGPLYDDAIARTRYALSLDPKNKLVAILWHQGESDVGWPAYQQSLDTMIVNMRKEINGDTNTYFLLGGLVPYWVNEGGGRQSWQTLIAATPQRVRHTAFVSPYYPFVIDKPNNAFADVHYDAAGQRELGRRYFRVLDSLLTH